MMSILNLKHLKYWLKPFEIPLFHRINRYQDRFLPIKAKSNVETLISFLPPLKYAWHLKRSHIGVSVSGHDKKLVPFKNLLLQASDISLSRIMMSIRTFHLVQWTVCWVNEIFFRLMTLSKCIWESN